VTTRRQFILTTLPAAALVIGTGRQLSAAEPARLQESEAIAVSLGYKHDATKVDAKKFPTYAAGHNCANCQFLKGGKAPWGACAPVGGKLVNAKGWCSAWVKRA